MQGLWNMVNTAKECIQALRDASDIRTSLSRGISGHIPHPLVLYCLDPANGIDMTTASESAGRQIQNNKIPQTYKYFTPF